MKFGRSYQMSLTGRSGLPITIGFPTTMTFSITHDIWAAANHAEFGFYGLSSTNRYEIYFNQYLKARTYPMVLNAGYISQNGGLLGFPGELPVVFKGFANVAYTEREGPELITRIQAIDNGDAMGSVAPSCLDGDTNTYIAPVGTTWITMIYSLIEKLNNVQIGDVIVDPDSVPGPITKPRTFIGNVWENLQSLAKDAGGAFVFIENGVCNVLGQNSNLGVSSLGVLQSSSGLLGIPKYTGATVLVSCIFEPSLSIGASLQLISEFSPWVNGQYTVVAYTHSGIISGVKSGECRSEITLASQNTTLASPDAAGNVSGGAAVA